VRGGVRGCVETGHLQGCPGSCCVVAGTPASMLRSTCYAGVVCCLGFGQQATSSPATCPFYLVLTATGCSVAV
jgi:hypothetical protein